jgi:hypothetical protein
MSRLKPDIPHYRWELAFLASLLAIFAYIWMRQRAQYPLVFADEWIYSSFARLLPLRETTIPSYLYLSVYGLTNACGTGFLGCARFLNLLFFIGSAPFIYLTARQYCGKPMAIALALMCMLAPFKSYTAYFMPESLYYFAFYVLTWIALTRGSMHWAGHALATGALLGLMTLVKIHALFLIPALCAFILFARWNNDRQGPWLRTGLAAACLAFAAALAVKFAVGYAIAGDNALNLFGSFYGAQANNSLGAVAKLMKLLPNALINLKGHLMALVLVIALPLAAIVHYILSRKARAQAGGAATALYVYAVLMTGTAFAMTVFFTASLVDVGPREILRLHLRYYNFTFPLLFMIAAAEARASTPAASSALRWAIVTGLAAAVVYSAYALIPAYDANMVDGPEIAALGLGRKLAPVVLALELGVLAVWAYKRSLAAPLFVFVFMPLYVINAERVTSGFIQSTGVPNLFDQAGTFTRAYIKDDERKDLAIAGTRSGELLRVKFHIDDARAELIELEPGAPLQPYQLPLRKKWLLVVGADHPLPPGITPLVKAPEFTLTRVDPNHRRIGVANLSEPLDGGLLDGAEGLWDAEPWGRWSKGKQVRLHFKQPLPKHLNLFLKGQSFGPNAALPYTLRVGQAATSFRIPSGAQELFFRLETDGGQKTMTIDIPRPASPKELGHSGDERQLGLGLISIEIGTPANGG